MNAIEQFKAAHAALLEERDALTVRLREINGLLGLSEPHLYDPKERPKPQGRPRGRPPTVREAIVRYVTEHPGALSGEILANLSGGSSHNHYVSLATAIARGTIRHEGRRGSYRYFPVTEE